MNKINYVGVDLSKGELVADLRAERSPKVFAQTEEGHRALIAALPSQAHVICEASGGYERALGRALRTAHIPFSVIMPGRVRAMAKAEGLRAKTDPIDAKLLTRFGEKYTPAAQAESCPAQVELKELLRSRQWLVYQLNQEVNFAEHCTHPLIQAQAQQRRDLLQQQLAAVEHQMRDLVKRHAPLAHRFALILQVQGIGEVSAWTVLAELPELGSLQTGQAGALLGVAPDPNESGPRKAKRRIGGGRAAARKVLYMAALTATRHNPILAAFYTRLVEQRKKPKLLALTAVMRKLAELLNRLLADPNFKLAG